MFRGGYAHSLATLRVAKGDKNIPPPPPSCPVLASRLGSGLLNVFSLEGALAHRQRKRILHLFTAEGEIFCIFYRWRQNIVYFIAGHSFWWLVGSIFVVGGSLRANSQAND